MPESKSGALTNLATPQRIAPASDRKNEARMIQEATSKSHTRRGSRGRRLPSDEAEYLGEVGDFENLAHGPLSRPKANRLAGFDGPLA